MGETAFRPTGQFSDRSEGAVESTPRDRGTSIGLYALFFCSGVSGLVYQVLWVRQFARVFGNTVYSGSVVVAIFMLGLGVGSYLFGVRADRRHAPGAVGLVRMYARLEIVIAALGLAISLLLPHFTAFVSLLSAYGVGPDGWRTLTTWSYV